MVPTFCNALQLRERLVGLQRGLTASPEEKDEVLEVSLSPLRAYGMLCVQMVACSQHRLGPLAAVLGTALVRRLPAGRQALLRHHTSTCC
jgi:hypothetical protein